MRISDWSSDVCSSDLPDPAVGSPQCAGGDATWRRAGGRRDGERRPGGAGRKRSALGRNLCRLRRSEERRVGKECVSVDLGGRRIIKKKNKNVKNRNIKYTQLYDSNMNMLNKPK